MNVTYRPKINLKENKEKTKKLREKIISQAESGLSEKLFLRPSGKYAMNKLGHIRKYIWTYSCIISKNFPDFYYLETHAGPGLCEIRKTGKIVCGTPILSLSNIPQFKKYRFIEFDDSCVNSLNILIKHFFPSLDTKVVKGDCNKIIKNVLNDFNKYTPILTIIDPEGTELHWKTLEELAEYKTDLIILFPYDMAIKRCVAPNCSPQVQNAVTRMYGSKLWKDIRDDHYIRKKINYSEMRRRFVSLYRDRLKHELDFPHVVVSKIIKGDNNQPLYYLIIAGRNKIVEKIGKDILDVKAEQTTLDL